MIPMVNLGVEEWDSDHSYIVIYSFLYNNHSSVDAVFPRRFKDSLAVKVASIYLDLYCRSFIHKINWNSYVLH